MMSIMPSRTHWALWVNVDASTDGRKFMMPALRFCTAACGSPTEMRRPRCKSSRRNDPFWCARANESREDIGVKLLEIMEMDGNGIQLIGRAKFSLQYHFNTWTLRTFPWLQMAIDFIFLGWETIACAPDVSSVSGRSLTGADCTGASPTSHAMDFPPGGHAIACTACILQAKPNLSEPLRKKNSGGQNTNSRTSGKRNWSEALRPGEIWWVVTKEQTICIWQPLAAWARSPLDVMHIHALSKEV